MRVEEKPAPSAPKNRSGHQYGRVRKDVPPHVFFLAEAATTLAPELPVEGVQRQAFWFELVLVSFYGPPCELGIHLDEGHHKRVGQYCKRSNDAGRSHRD